MVHEPSIIQHGVNRDTLINLSKTREGNDRIFGWEIERDEKAGNENKLIVNSFEFLRNSRGNQINEMTYERYNGAVTNLLRVNINIFVNISS